MPEGVAGALLSSQQLYENYFKHRWSTGTSPCRSQCICMRSQCSQQRTGQWGKALEGQGPTPPRALDFCRRVSCTHSPMWKRKYWSCLMSNNYRYTHTHWPAHLQFPLSQHHEHVRYKLIWGKHEAGPHLSSSQSLRRLNWFSVLLYQTVKHFLPVVCLFQ